MQTKSKSADSRKTSSERDLIFYKYAGRFLITIQKFSQLLYLLHETVIRQSNIYKCFISFNNFMQLCILANSFILHLSKQCQSCTRVDE